jgi:hypothetical protein
MTGNKSEHDRVERLGRRIVRASAASSPFLYARLRARINSEGTRREEKERWLTLFGVVWRAVPAMALVAVFAFVLFLSAAFTRSGGSYTDEAILGERDAGVERVVFANDRQPISRDDVLATILSDEERGNSR